MLNFTYQNPVNIIFGKGTIAELSKLIPKNQTVLITYGGGSIKKNGVYSQVLKALRGYNLFEFGGIESNPQYDTLMNAVQLVKEKNIDFLLAVGGGSVLDGTKFIAVAAKYEGKEPWDILTKGACVKDALPLASLMTLPASGSEMNGFAVISRNPLKEKRGFGSPHCYPIFSILDPETTYSLPERQVSNGIVDTFVHATEQYLTVRDNSPLQDRQAEAILKTIIEEAPKVSKYPMDYNVRANLMWCSTQALNGLIGCGVTQDWATHMIGHELTVIYGLDHGQTLAIILPALLRHQKTEKLLKLVRYGEVVWGIENLSIDEMADEAIQRTETFFNSLGVKTKLKEYGLNSDHFEVIARRIVKKGMALGENGNIGEKEIVEILRISLE